MMKINDEYLCAVRTKSFADFFVQAQHLLANDPYPTHCHPSDLLLNPAQETIASLLKSCPKSPHLKSLFSNYFHVSAEASRLCTNLLTTLIRLKNRRGSIAQSILSAADDDDYSSRREFFRLAISDLNELQFEEIRERQSRLLQQLMMRSSRRKMAGKLGAVEFLRSLVVRKRGFGVVEAAAKGAYILKRDFDTIGRLVARIGGEMEHERAVVERGGGCLELEALKKGEFGVRRQAEELEEQVYLCLLTINRARAMVVTQICTNSAHDY